MTKKYFVFLIALAILCPLWAYASSPTPVDTLTLNISEDAYLGNAKYTVSVDGQQIGGTYTATALYSAGQNQNLSLTGNFGNGPHIVAVNFLNDAYGGTKATDRNLYVNSITLDGVSIMGSAQYSAGSRRYRLPAQPAAVTTGGTDTLTLHISEDAYLGNALYTVSVDGKQIGGTYTATALHSAGQSQTQTLMGNFGNGPHIVTVNFLNDAYGGSRAKDRNLFVNSITLDNVTIAGATQYSAGSRQYSVPAQPVGAVNGACGISSGASSLSIPATNLCTAGTASNVAGNGPWSWNCAGTGGGTTATCSASLITNGSCGVSNGISVTGAPSTGLCAKGNASSVAGNGPWNWNCAGTNGGATAACSAIVQINGACGIASGASSLTAPAGGLCSAGMVSAVSGSGPWSWNCIGGNGGSNAVCAAPLQASKTDSDTSSGTNPPIIFNATDSARAGEIVTLQGAHFGANPAVWLQRTGGAADMQLLITNSVNDVFLAAQIPSSATGAIILRIVNGSNISAPIEMNAAKPLHLDSLQIVPGGIFRIFGRNLQLGSYMSSVSVDGQAAQIDTANSDEHMLTVMAPANLKETSSSVILVNNGNGSGTGQLDENVEVVTGVSGDPFNLQIGWTAQYSPLLQNVIDVACENNANDGTIIQNAINQLPLSGGIVQINAGTCDITSVLSLKSRVVLQGAGKDVTVLNYSVNYAVWGQNLDLIGLRDLTMTNIGTQSEGPILNHDTHVLIQNVKFNYASENQSFMDTNQQLVISGCDFIQTGSPRQQSPYLFTASSGFTFINNTTTFMMGAPNFDQTHDAYIKGNVFTRDSNHQYDQGALHMMVVNFATRIAIVGNTFNTINGPITNTQSNDGETILTEGGGSTRTENIGQVSSATLTTIYDPNLTLQTSFFDTPSIGLNYGIAIVGGTGTGQTRYVTGYSNNTISVDRPWDLIPDATSTYATFVWGLEKSLIKSNTLVNMPRGIWLYTASIRDIDIVSNNISEGGGIFLKSFQSISQKMFDPIYNIRIDSNVISNSTHRWMSYANAIFVNTDAEMFGMAMTGINFNNNTVTANIPNVSSQMEDYAGNECFFNMMRVQSNNKYTQMPVPRILGTVFQRNTSVNCGISYTLGTGDGGTTIRWANQINSPQTYADWVTTSTPGLASTWTVVQ